MTSAPAGARSPRLRVQLVVASLARIVTNTAHRMVYPFLPVFARGLGVPLETLTGLISLRGALGMSAPLFGSLPDHIGRRRAMLLGLGLFVAALLLPVLLPGLWTFAAALLLVVVVKFIFDTALQAYVGDRTPYHQRGLAIAFTELAWSSAALIGFPLVGLAVARGGWQGPFLPLAGLGLLGWAAVWFTLPRDADAPPTRPPGSLGVRWLDLWRRPSVVAALGLAVLIAAANESLLVVLGAWLEQSFGLSVAALGLSTTIIGVAELAGEGLVMGLADRLGKRRAVGLGLVASAAAYLAMPFLAARLALALVALFLVFIAFEFTIVASLPLMTEQMPEARSRVMSTYAAGHAAGRMLGALLGAALFRQGFVWNGVAALGLNLVGLLVVVLFVRE